MVAARTATETERVRNTLLASDLHDFRTPLSSILGSATSLIDYGDKLGPEARNGLLGQIKRRGRRPRRHGPQPAGHDAHRCRRAGAAHATGSTCARSWSASSSRGAPPRGATPTLGVQLPDDLPLVHADADAGRAGARRTWSPMPSHTRRKEPPSSSVPRPGLRSVVLAVTDDGPGIPPELLPRVFDKFVRARGHRGRQGRGHGSRPRHRQRHHGGARRRHRSREPGRQRAAARASCSPFPREEAAP